MSGTIDTGKQRKRNLLLGLIRSREGACKAVLKEWSGLSMESVIRYVEELTREGLITTAGYSRPSVGRKAAYLTIRPEGCFFLGLRFSPLGLNGVIVDFSGEVRCRREELFYEGIPAGEVLERLCVCAAGLMEELGGDRERLLGIGVAVPGLVDRENGVGIRYVHIPGWENVPVREILEERLGLPVTVEHSLKATALAAARLPENRGIQDLLFLLVGRGVGMAILADGEIYPGAANLSGEIGHIFSASNGVRCRCGRTGCLETVAGSPAVVRRLAEGLEAGRFPLLRRELEAGTPLSVELLARGAALGDPDASEEVRQVSRCVGEAVSTAVTLLNPEKLILSGEIGAAPGFAEGVLSELRDRCFPEALKMLRYAYQPQDNWFDARAAAALAYERCFGLSPAERKELNRWEPLAGPVGII